MIAFIATEKYSESNPAQLSGKVAKTAPTMVDHADFISKLRQIEETSCLVGAGVQDGGVKANMRHIALVAQTLRSRLERGAVAVVQLERKLPDDAVNEPPA